MTKRRLEEDEIDLASLFHECWIRKWMLIIGIALGGLLALIPCFLIQPQWTTSSVFVSSTKSGSNLSSLSSMASLVGLGSLGGAEGKESYYEQIIHSRDFLMPLLSQRWETDSGGTTKTIQELYHLKSDNATQVNRLADPEYLINNASLEILRSSISYSKDAKSGVMYLDVTVPDPIACLRIHEAILDNLQKYNSNDAISKARKERQFAENQLDGFEKDLERAENRLTVFRRNNMILKSPGLETEQARLTRDVQIASTLVIEFRKQAELAKLNEEKEKNYIDIIESPSVPLSKSKPKRRVIVLGGMFAGGTLAFALILFLIARQGSRRKDEQQS